MKKVSQQRWLTDEESKIVENSIGLVYFVVQTDFHVHKYSSDYDDMVAIGNFGLIKAAQEFNKELNSEFSTFARTCIQNEIRMMYYRKRKRKKELINMDMHIEDVIGEDKNGNKMTLENIMEDPKANFIEEIFKQQETIRVLEIVLNCLKPRDTIILLSHIAKKTQSEITEIIGISRASQAYISLRLKKIRLEVQKTVNTTVELNKMFQVTKKEDLYQITFPLGKIGDVDVILPKILSEVKTEDLSDLLITYDCNEVTIKMQLNSDSFSAIAQIYDTIYKKYPEFFNIVKQ